MGGSMGGCVGWWVGSGQITKYQINLDLIEIIQDLWFVETPPPMGGSMGGWMDGWVDGLDDGWGQVKSLEIE